MAMLRECQLDEEGSGHIRVREALRTLACNKWVEIDPSVGALRIRLGERAKKLAKAAS